MRIHHSVVIRDDGLGAKPDAVERAERHHERAAVLEADDLAGDLRTAPPGHADASADADRAEQATDSDEQTLNAGNPAEGAVVGQAIDFGDEAIHGGLRSLRSGGEPPFLRHRQSARLRLTDGKGSAVKVWPTYKDYLFGGKRYHRGATEISLWYGAINDD